LADGSGHFVNAEACAGSEGQGSVIIRSLYAWLLLPECACGAVRPSPLQVQTEPVSHPKRCVKTVSDAPPNLDRTARRTGHSDFTWLLREVVDQKCVGGFRCASARAAGIYFQACSFNHSDISPSLESTTYERSANDYRTRRGRWCRNPLSPEKPKT
jgi:hypothetical protein